MTRRMLVSIAGLCLFVACGSKGQPPSAPQAGVGPLPASAPRAASPLPPRAGDLPAAAPPALVAYLDGLDALNQGRASDAAAAFSRVLDISGDDPSFVLARGVAETLAEQFQPALSDLERAKRLGLRGREAELWTYAAEAMSGNVGADHAFPGPRTGPGLVSIPGHIAQGGDDYPTDYGSFIAYDLGSAYQHLRLPPDRGGAGTPDAVKGPAMRAAMLKAGQWFASRAMRRPDLAAAHIARARSLHDAQQYEAALREIAFGRAAYPAQPDLLFLSADCWLALGRPATARREFTMALTSRTDFGAAYLGRAAAAARLGDRKRTTADLTIAGKLDAALTARLRPGIEAELARQHVDGAPDKLNADLDQAARSGATVEAMLETATKLQKITGEQRLRYDEIYQDRLRTLEDAVRASPKNADRYADLAKYLVDEADNRGEAVEPRRAVENYRFQVSSEQDLTRAIQVADLGLAIDPKHVGSLIEKAMALTALQRYDQADPLADQALAVAGNNPDALRLYAKFRAMRADQLSAEASSLRQDRCSSASHDEDRGSYTDHITTTTCYPPSQAQLQRANQLDAVAADLRSKARGAMERALQASRGTVEGFLIEADLHVWDGQLDAAQASLLQAVKRDPSSLEAQDELVQFYARTGQKDQGEEQQAIERQLINTTAAPLLRLAWARTATTAWSAAAGYLSRARQLDPVDARVPAYLGVVLEGQGKAADAAAAYQTAIALEEARLRLDEPHDRSGPPLTRDPIDFGLVMRARLRTAAPLERAGRAANAVDLYVANAAYKPRISPGDYSRQMFTAMLPDDQGQNGSLVPAPVNAATLLAESAFAAGMALETLGRKDDAVQEFLAAVSFVPAAGSMAPKIGNSRGDTNFAGWATEGVGGAFVELARLSMEKGQYDDTRRYLQGASNAHIPDAMRNEVNQLNMALAQILNSRPQAAPQQFQDPERQHYADLQRQQDEARAQAASRYVAANAVAPPELVGTWDLAPDNTYLPFRKTLTIDAAANYSLTTVADNRTVRGKISAQRGQMLLAPDGGPVGTMYYQAAGPNQLAITDLDGTKYHATRK